MYVRVRCMCMRMNESIADLNTAINDKSFLLFDRRTMHTVVPGVKKNQR